MKRAISGAIIGVMSWSGLSGNALAADCASRLDMNALRLAAMQQELMVAALSCHEIARYNQFVLSHQPELIDSDARLKSFFIARGGRAGEAAYHTFKTELANDSSLRSVREVETFCGEADRAFDAALQAPSLSSLLGDSSIGGDVPYAMCPTVQAARELAPAESLRSPLPARRGDNGSSWPDVSPPSRGASTPDDIVLPSPHREADDPSP